MARPSGREATAQAHRFASEFFGGFTTLFRGFSWWKRRPDLMLLGLLPALIVAVAIVILVLTIATYVEGFVGWATPFADGWDPLWRGVLRILLSLTLLIGFVVIAVFSFTALTLLIGDWFYERIWRAAEQHIDGYVPTAEPPFWRTVGDSLLLAIPAVFTGILVSVIGFIPVVGTVLGAVLGVIFSGRILARELTTRPLEARGLTRAQRRDLLRTRPRRVLGFGVAVQLCFLVPGGAIVVMPAAVAGATHLARDLLAGVGEASSSAQPPPPAPRP